MAIGSSNPSSAAQPVVWASVLAVLAAATALLWADEPSSLKGDPVVTAVPKGGVNPYSKLSNEQLGALTRTFEDLDRDQRRWFLTEVRKRMSAKGTRPQIEVGKDDRFGHAGRNAKVPRGLHDPGASPTGDNNDAPKVYGTGLPSRPKETADGSLPDLRSEDPSKPVE